MVIITRTLSGSVRLVKYVGTDILSGCTHMSSLTSLSFALDRSPHMWIMLLSGAVSTQTQTNTHTHTCPVYTCPIMTNHPFPWLSHLRGLLQQWQLRWGKRRLTDVESLNLATAFTFILSGCFISSRSLRFCRRDCSGTKFLKTWFKSGFHRGWFIFLFFFCLLGVFLSEAGVGNFVQFNLTICAT